MPPTKSAMKNTRWVLMEQRVEFLEEKMDINLKALDEKISSLKSNEIAHINTSLNDLKGEVTRGLGDLKKEFAERRNMIDQRLESIQRIIYKAVGALGAILTVINIALKVWK